MSDDLPTLGHYRNYHGIRSLVIRCGNFHHCWHQTVINADFLPDDVVVKSLEPRMICTECGWVGADVRPAWPEQHPRKRR